MSGKGMTMAEAINRFVPDGAPVVIGTALEPLIPFAAGHEMIRQGRRDLELIGPISDALFDQLVGAGCVGRVTAAWVGNVSEGLGHCYRRACASRSSRARWRCASTPTSRSRVRSGQRPGACRACPLALFWEATFFAPTRHW